MLMGSVMQWRGVWLPLDGRPCAAVALRATCRAQPMRVFLNIPLPPPIADLQVELHRMWEKEPGVVAVRWSAAASPRLLDGLLATGSACMSLDGVSGEVNPLGASQGQLCWAGRAVGRQAGAWAAAARRGACADGSHRREPSHPRLHPLRPCSCCSVYCLKAP